MGTDDGAQRRSGRANNARFRFGECVLDAAARELRRKGEPVHLSPKAFELLLFALQERPRALSKHELHDRLWPSTFVSAANLPSLVKEVRAAIGDDARSPRYLRTAFGHGYAFSGEAEVETPERGHTESLAVLPLATAAPSDGDFVADGVTEGLINSLARAAGLAVVPRATVFRLRDRADDPLAVARELGVQVVISGRLRRRGKRLNLQLEILSAQHGTQIWGEQLDFDETQVQAIVEDLTRRIAERLRLHLPEPAARAAETSAERREAYRLCLEGRFHWSKRTKAAMEKAIDCFRQAIAVDPSFAEAHVGLGNAFITLGSRDLLAPLQAFPQASEAVLAALELDDDFAAAHVSRAAIFEVFEWRWKEAEQEFLRALALAPRDGSAHHWYALFLGRRGRFAEAFEQLGLAVALDPAADHSVVIHCNTTLLHYLAHDFPRAATAARRALELDPFSEEAHLGLGVAELQLGHHAEALRALERANEVSGEHVPAAASLAHAHAIAGHRKRAEAMLDELLASAQRRHVSSALTGLVRLGLGQKAEAVRDFERAEAERSGWLPSLEREPRIAELRREPRFRALLRRIGEGAREDKRPRRARK